MLDFTNLSRRQVRSWINFVSSILPLSPHPSISFLALLPSRRDHLDSGNPRWHRPSSTLVPFPKLINWYFLVLHVNSTNKFRICFLHCRCPNVDKNVLNCVHWNVSPTHRRCPIYARRAIAIKTRKCCSSIFEHCYIFLRRDIWPNWNGWSTTRNANVSVQWSISAGVIWNRNGWNTKRKRRIPLLVERNSVEHENCRCLNVNKRICFSHL